MIKQHDCNVFDPYQDMAELDFFPAAPLERAKSVFQEEVVRVANRLSLVVGPDLSL